MASAIATIEDVKREVQALEEAMRKDPSLAGQVGKKLATAIEFIKVKDGVTKDLNQAYTNAEKWWAVKVFSKETEGCTQDNKDVKVKEHVVRSSSYLRHLSNPDTMEKTEQWLAKKFVRPESQE